MRIVRSLPAIIAAMLLAAAPLPSPAQFSVGIGFTVGSPPPPIPYYEQPPAPYPNYQWTPGYWAWGPAGYYWVPGTWVAPPSIGLYWTPGYWGYGGGYGGGYGWNAGYWGASVGFYGGVNYGGGYYGNGFVGGTWGPGGFRYNTAVYRVNNSIHNTYVNKTVINNPKYYNHSRVSYNGGRGGINAKPTSAQVQARRSGRAPTTDQRNQARIAANDRNLYAHVNKGKPPITASQKPFSNTNKPPNAAPITSADKQAAQKQVKHAGAPTTMQGQGKKQGQGTMQTQGKKQGQGTMQTQGKPPTTTMHKPPTTTMHKPPTTTYHKPPTTTYHKPPATTYHKPQATTYHKPPATTYHKPPTTTYHPQGSMQGKPSGKSGGNKPPGSSGKPPR